MGILDWLRRRTRGSDHQRWVVVDVETSGMDVANDALISIGAVAIVDGRIVPGDIVYPLAKVTLAQAAPILPYLLLVLILILRPKGLLGTRED